MKKFKEWFNIQLVKNPGRLVLAAILIFNVLFFLLASAIISALSLDGTQHMNFIEAAFYTLTMILDAGCISYVVADIGTAGVAITIVCIAVVLIGMISFTGAVIGYVTNYISTFIENADNGKHKVMLSDHFVILNWNSRASEIINDMLYCDEKQRVVVLVQGRKDEIEKEIDERLSATISRENKALLKEYKNYNFIKRYFAFHKNRLKKKVTVIVREGDVFSSKQLFDVSLDKAKSIIVLGNDINNTVCKFEHKEVLENKSRGNSHTIKTLMQVMDIVSAESSSNDQKIIVEITDDWTLNVVEQIIQAKRVEGKCNVVPIKVNEVLGQILSQFCLTPELNTVYSELFSSKGVEFYSVKEKEKKEELSFIGDYLQNHNHAVPITVSEQNGKYYSYYVGENYSDVFKKSNIDKCDYWVNLKKNYWIERKNVVILGHNSKCKNIMAGFQSFSNEWKNGDEEIVQIVVIDDKKNLEKMNYYKEYSFVCKTVEADVYDKDIVKKTINEFVEKNETDTSILILSDDTALNEDIDANALANLVAVSDIIRTKKEENPDFDLESIDVIVEIIDPKHHDIVNSYSINNVVISNRYISKMVTQISEVEALYGLYTDILSYDDGSEECESKEIYVKKVSRYFETPPQNTTADKLIRAVYEASLDKDVAGFINPTIVLGYVKPGNNVVLFGGDLSKIKINFEPLDKLVLFTAH